MAKTPTRVILISGANRGIGFETAKYLYGLPEEYCRLSLAARNPKELEKEFGPPNDRLQFIEYDALDPDAPEKNVAAVIEKYGYITDLFNNAGCSSRVDFMDDDEEGFLHDYRVNTLAPWRMMQASMPHLEKMTEKMGDTTVNIINGGSRTGLRVRRTNVSYAASKFGLTGVNDTAAVYCAKKKNGVRVTLLAPSYVDTKMSERSTKPAEDSTGDC